MLTRVLHSELILIDSFGSGMNLLIRFQHGQKCALDLGRLHTSLKMAFHMWWKQLLDQQRRRLTCLFHNIHLNQDEQANRQ